MTETVLAEVDLGHMFARAVRAPVSDEVRTALMKGGVNLGEEIIEIRIGDDSGQPVLGERPTDIILDADRRLIFGLLPRHAASIEVVAPDGTRVPGNVGDGVWLTVVPDNQLGAEYYPVLFRDARGAPLNPGLPRDWDREPVGPRGAGCPACGNDAWDLVTAAWQGVGALRNTRWGNINGTQPGRAYVCRTCGHEVRVGAPIRNPRP